ELLTETGGGLAGAGEEENAADGLVEAVNDAEEDVAGLVIFVLEVGLDGAIDGFLGALEVGGGDPGRLVDRQAMIVLVEDLQWRKTHGRDSSPRVWTASSYWAGAEKEPR